MKRLKNIDKQKQKDKKATLDIFYLVSISVRSNITCRERERERERENNFLVFYWSISVNLRHLKKLLFSFFDGCKNVKKFSSNYLGLKFFIQICVCV